MRFFYILPLLLLPSAVFSMNHAVQDSEEPVGPSIVEVENFDLNIVSDGGRGQQTIVPKPAPVVETPRVFSDWDLQLSIRKILNLDPSFENPTNVHQHLLRCGLDVPFQAVQRNMLDAQLKNAIEWALRQNYRAYNANSNRPSNYGAQVLHSYISSLRAGGWPGTTPATVERLMRELVACDQGLIIQLERVRTAECSKERVYQLLLREGFQVERSRVEKIYYQYRAMWQWAS